MRRRRTRVVSSGSSTGCAVGTAADGDVERERPRDEGRAPPALGITSHWRPWSGTKPWTDSTPPPPGRPPTLAAFARRGTGDADDESDGLGLARPRDDDRRRPSPASTFRSSTLPSRRALPRELDRRKLGIRDAIPENRRDIRVGDAVRVGDALIVARGAAARPSREGCPHQSAHLELETPGGQV